MPSSIEIQALEKIVQKLDSSIDKLTEVSANISKLLAVQEQRLNTIEKDTIRNEDDIRHVYYKIDTMTKELSVKIDEFVIVTNGGYTQMKSAVEQQIKDVNDRIMSLENWRWFILGGAMVLGWLINYITK